MDAASTAAATSKAMKTAAAKPRGAVAGGGVYGKDDVADCPCGESDNKGDVGRYVK